MTLQERKDKSDIIAKRGDLVYKKLFLLVAVAGSSWIFGIKESGILSYFSLIVFLLSAIGVVVNLFRLGDATKKIKELENDN